MLKRYWIPVEVYDALVNNPDGIAVECRGGAPILIQMVKSKDTEAKDDE
jgi:hypothetical protein